MKPNNSVPKRAIVDLDQASFVSGFINREIEQELILQWAYYEKCKIIGIFGIGGIGKTSLAINVVRALRDKFDYIIFRSVTNSPPLGELLLNITPNNVKTDFIQFLRDNRCLLILDNIESILHIGASTGYYRQGYEDYGLFFEKIAKEEHQSCIIITGREQPIEISNSKNNKSIKTLYLEGMDLKAAKEMLLRGGIKGTDAEYESVIDRFQGNPLALKLFMYAVNTIYDGDIKLYTNDGYPLFGDIQDLLEQQFNRLSNLENQILSIVALNNGSIALENIRLNLRYLTSDQSINQATANLARRSLISIRSNTVFIQPVTLEYIRSRLTRLLSNIKSSLPNQEQIIKVFLSYAREDVDIVKTFYQKLTRSGLRPWMDIYDLLPGQKWKSSIKRALKESDFVLIFLSRRSVSKRGFVQKEIRDAVDISQEMLSEDIFIIPARLDDCDVPESLSAFQWVNLYDEGSWERLIQSFKIGFEKRKREGEYGK